MLTATCLQCLARPMTVCVFLPSQPNSQNTSCTYAVLTSSSFMRNLLYGNIFFAVTLLMISNTWAFSLSTGLLSLVILFIFSTLVSSFLVVVGCEAAPPPPPLSVDVFPSPLSPPPTPSPPLADAPAIVVSCCRFYVSLIVALCCFFFPCKPASSAIFVQGAMLFFFKIQRLSSILLSDCSFVTTTDKFKSLLAGM